MKPTSIIALLLSTTTASVIGAPHVSAKDTTAVTALTKRDNCGAGELKVYENGSNFLCVGKTVFWTGVAISAVYAPTINAAASQFGTWVVNKFTGAPSATESAGKRSNELEIWDEDENTITYGWKPSSLTMRAASGNYATGFSWIHNMTKSYDKTTGNLTEATMTFDGEHDEWNTTEKTISKRANTPITITYYAVSGHQTTSLGYQDIVNLYTQAFFSSPGGAGSECGYAANSGTWHGAFKITVSGCTDAGTCVAERQF